MSDGTNVARGQESRADRRTRAMIVSLRLLPLVLGRSGLSRADRGGLWGLAVLSHGAITSRVMRSPAIVKSHFRSAVPPGKLPVSLPVTR